MFIEGNCGPFQQVISLILILTPKKAVVALLKDWKDEHCGRKKLYCYNESNL